MKRAPIVDAMHPGPNVSKIPVGGGVAGLLVVVSILVIALIGLPATRLFLAGAVALGVVMALILRWKSRGRI